jgi:hypothetical protein
MYGTKRKLSKKEKSERHLRHCQDEVRRNPNNKYWKDQVEKTKKILGICD